MRISILDGIDYLAVLLEDAAKSFRVLWYIGGAKGWQVRQNSFDSA